MKHRERSLMLGVAAAVTLLAAAAGPSAGAAAIAAARSAAFDEADLYIELNDTDGDLGLHALIDGDSWRLLEIEGPDGSQNLEVTASGALLDQGLTEIFFESAEPPFDELPPEEFFARFPAGLWEISGLTLDGEELESHDRLSHVMPAPPEHVLVSGVAAAEDCDVEPLPAVAEPVVVRWDPVTTSHPEVGASGPVHVAGYQLVLEREEPSLLVFSVDLPPEVTEFEVPEGFTALGDSFKFEILVLDRTGNRTAIESCFDLE